MAKTAASVGATVTAVAGSHVSCNDLPPAAGVVTVLDSSPTSRRPLTSSNNMASDVHPLHLPDTTNKRLLMSLMMGGLFLILFGQLLNWRRRALWYENPVLILDTPVNTRWKGSQTDGSACAWLYESIKFCPRRANSASDATTILAETENMRVLSKFGGRGVGEAVIRVGEAVIRVGGAVMTATGAGAIGAAVTTTGGGIVA